MNLVLNILEDDSIMGYYKTNQESLKILREYFTKIKMNILDDEYACEYNPICENNEIKKITKLKKKMIIYVLIGILLLPYMRL
jgi:hypothetical protein